MCGHRSYTNSILESKCGNRKNYREINRWWWWWRRNSAHTIDEWENAYKIATKSRLIYCGMCVGHAYVGMQKTEEKKNKEIKRKETTIAVGQTEITISQVELLSIDRVPVCNFSLRFVAVVSCLQYSQKICASTRNMHSVQMMGFLMHFFFFFHFIFAWYRMLLHIEKKIINIF